MAENPPYMQGYGTLGKVLDKIKTAAVPERFTQDFLATKLGFKGGTPKPVIPLLKRLGFLSTDGTPTELYKRFRNPDQSGAAMAHAIRAGFSGLYERNEYLHELSDAELRNLVVEATGAEKDSSTVKAIVGTFKTLKEKANFEKELEAAPAKTPVPTPTASPPAPPASSEGVGINLSYTINLNLPATTDVAVFDAIFKSLKEHLLGK